MSVINIHEPDATDSRFHVWIDTNADCPFDGICIGVGETRREAIENAAADLEDAKQQLFVESR